MELILGWGSFEVSNMKTPANVTEGDLVYFDVKSTITPEQLRIWALRESKLPMRMRFFDPRNVEAMIFLFDYDQEQDDSFFAPHEKTVSQDNTPVSGGIQKPL